MKCGAIFSGSAAMVIYSILFDSSSTNRIQPEVKPCKVEIRKAKMKVACGDNTQT